MYSSYDEAKFKFRSPMSQTLSLKLFWTSVLTLNPCVGITSLMDSFPNRFSIVVFPELSSPRSRILASLSFRLSFWSKLSSPILSTAFQSLSFDLNDSAVEISHQLERAGSRCKKYFSAREKPCKWAQTQQMKIKTLISGIQM